MLAIYVFYSITNPGHWSAISALCHWVRFPFTLLGTSADSKLWATLRIPFRFPSSGKYVTILIWDYKKSNSNLLRLLILKLEMSGILILAPLHTTYVTLVKLHNLLSLNFLMPFVLQYHPPYCAFHFHTCVTMQRPFWPFQASAFCFLCLWNTIHPSWSNTNATSL